VSDTTPLPPDGTAVATDARALAPSTPMATDARLGEMYVALTGALQKDDAGAVEAVRARYPDLAAAIDDCCRQHRVVARELARLRSATPDSVIPRRLGRYELFEQLGEGGMASVFRARDTHTGEEVALKVNRRPEREERRRFVETYKLAKGLDYAHILPVLDVGEQGDFLYITMPLVPGGRTLQSWIDEGHRDAREVVQLLIPIVKAVGHLNVEGKTPIIHRDIKPSNILLANNDTLALLGDFGVARTIAERGFTATGAAVGTPAFMSPEQAAGQPLEMLSDIFSLGAVLYAALTGQLPFQGDSLDEIQHAVREKDPPWPPLIRAVGVPLAAIVLKCLEKRPRHRYQRTAALAEDLQLWLGGHRVSVELRGPVSRAWARLGRRPKRNIVVALALSILVGLPTERAIAVRREQRERQQQAQQLWTTRQEEVRSNLALDALLHAQILAERFRVWGEMVSAAASDPELRAGLRQWVADSSAARPAAGRQAAARRRLQLFTERLSERAARPLEAWHTFDPQGVMISRTPLPLVEGLFDDRDYFAGSKRHLSRRGFTGVHVSAAYRSRADKHLRFDLSAAVADASGRIVGVVAVAATSEPRLGLPARNGEQTVLIGPWDPDRRPDAQDDGAHQRVVVSHPAFAGQEQLVVIEGPSLPLSLHGHCNQELARTTPANATVIDDYRDPVKDRYPEYGGRWLAAYAPVGDTGFVVVVQRRPDEPPGVTTAERGSDGPRDPR
jgi:hypothetical protein